MKRYCTILLSLLIFQFLLPAKSVMQTKTLTQPDGYSFTSRFRGDEFLKILTTADGYPIVKGEDGWWYYSAYINGEFVNSGMNVGRSLPSNSLGIEARIPEEIIQKSQKNRRSAIENLSNRCLLAADGIQTKADGIQTKATKTNYKCLIILAEFADVRFKHTKADFENLINNKTLSAKQYFKDQFGQECNFYFQISEIVTLSKNMEFYGSNDPTTQKDQYAHMLIADACRLAANAGVDFSLYDEDNDGYVDNVFVFYAGKDEAEWYDSNPEYIWPHAWYLYHGAGEKVELNGKIIDKYACASELSRIVRTTDTRLAGIGTFCHEYSHTIGTKDLYDTDYEMSGGMAGGTWIRTSLMDGGNANNSSDTPPYFNAHERELLGISTPTVISNDGTFTLEPIHKNGQIYRIDANYENEYYLLENRSNEGWDEYIGGKGLLVYHIDRSDRKTYSELYEMYLTCYGRWQQNEINCRPDRQCVNILEADNRTDSFVDYNDAFINSASNIAGIFYPYGGTEVALKYWNGENCSIKISNIAWDGENIKFSVSGISGEVVPPIAQNIKADVFQDAAIISFNSNKSTALKAKIKITDLSDNTVLKTVDVTAYETGKYSFTIEGLSPSTTYSYIIYFKDGNVEGTNTTGSFMTKRPQEKRAYIYLNSVTSRNSDGSFKTGSLLPLRLNNASEAKEIKWFFQGEEISAEGNGYYKLNQSGELRAVVNWDEKGEEIIIKELVVK